jgi:hypothetical protein
MLLRRGEISLNSRASRPDLGPTQPPYNYADNFCTEKAKYDPAEKLKAQRPLLSMLSTCDLYFQSHKYSLHVD